jgi:hypothetical protein
MGERYKEPISPVGVEEREQDTKFKTEKAHNYFISILKSGTLIHTGSVRLVAGGGGGG